MLVLTQQTRQFSFLEFLVNEGQIEVLSAKRVQVASGEAGTSVLRSLLELGLVDEEALFRSLAKFEGLPFCTLDEMDTALVETLSLPIEFLQRAEIAPVRLVGQRLMLATSNPEDKDAADSIGYLLDKDIELAIATSSSIKSALNSAVTSEIDEASHPAQDDIEKLTALANEGPVIKQVNEIIAQAIEARASDVHIEATETGAQIRLRIDGVLAHVRDLSANLRAAVTSRVKVMARLNISEKRRPQDGRLQVSVKGRTVDIRLSTLPTQFGESVVMRLLDRSRVALDWYALGYGEERIAQIEDAVRQPNGVFLVAGPTGSGKTTTLYTALNSLSAVEKKIVTVEDPIEYSLPGINQVQVEPQINMSFANALRSILRQDPDVILVGEIRDHETAEIAFRAALVGRMVLSTVHTNEALSAIIRLRDLGVPSYIIAATLRGVLSQRLVRTLCPSCGGSGCENCQSTGSHGRTVVSEFLEISSAIRAAISEESDLSTLSEVAAQQNFLPMRQTVKHLVEENILDNEEALRMTGTT